MVGRGDESRNSGDAKGKSKENADHGDSYFDGKQGRCCFDDGSPLSS